MDKKTTLNKLMREQEMRSPGMASLPAKVFEDIDSASLNLQEGFAKEDKKELDDGQLIDKIKELLEENVTTELSPMLRESKSYQGWGLWIAAIGVGMGAVSISMPVKFAYVYLYAGAGVTYSGLMLAFSGYRFERIAKEFPKHRDRMDDIGDCKIPFNKVWFEHWRNGKNVPNYRIAMLLSTSSVLLLIVTTLYLFLNLVRL